MVKLAAKIIVKAEREIAYESPDHLFPFGSKQDNSRNGRFNQKLYRLFCNNLPYVSALDLGCAGGGFVRDCINDGHFAIGLEGSNYSKLLKRAEWAIIPEFLFTCDITRDFEILELNEETQIMKRLFFDVVTAWEVMEHIPEKDLEKLAMNVKRHLKSSGLWIMSISTLEHTVNGVKWHSTVHKKEWWLNKFRQLGFVHLEEYVKYFNTQFVRGPKYNAFKSFHLVLSLDKSQAPVIPGENLYERLLDLWFGSLPQRAIRKLLIGD